MRLVRVGHEGTARHGIRTDDDTVRLLRGTHLDPGDRANVVAEVPLAEVTLLPPVLPTKILAVGGNYADHMREMSMAAPPVPMVFAKPLESLVPHGGTVVVPPVELSNDIEHEAELAIVIGRRARWVSRADAAAYVLGFTCANDVSARDLQRAEPGSMRPKGFDTFCPLGPHVETDVDVTAPRSITCSVNGELRQSGSTRALIHDVPALVEFFSSWTTLEPGDVILTGTPGGTGAMRPGDRVHIAIEGVGVLEHGVAAAPLDVTASGEVHTDAHV